ncbi:helix-turn-helix domain-containing protein [Caulobacter zeae]|uniref:helix-turn-helix domain-containing protein n=1 Tax=Caulobacter zeae TaxID=2055137 RepID=UPI0023E7FEBF|nr:leucine zipper domain-containing protein [Caulobacter zeae]
MNVHENAQLTPVDRALMIDRIDQGWSLARAAEASGVSRRTVGKWLQRHRRGGERRLADGFAISAEARTWPRSFEWRSKTLVGPGAVPARNR